MPVESRRAENGPLSAALDLSGGSTGFVDGWC